MARRPASSVDYPWYDSLWLSAFERARRTVERVVPSRLAEFDAAFEILRTPTDFEVKLLPQVFDDAVLGRLREVAATLAPHQLELHEARAFRRFVVHDHPVFNELQQQTLGLVSELVGEPVEASYNFLSLYGPQGVCPIHMDAPLAKWTLDLCISQGAPWPIHFSPVIPWPTNASFGNDWEAAIKAEVGPNFTSHSLLPGQALLFAGSSQWHYRDPMPAGSGQQFCDLLFFHFIPRGTRGLIDPGGWAQRFGIPELEQANGKGA